MTEYRVDFLSYLSSSLESSECTPCHQPSTREKDEQPKAASRRLSQSSRVDGRRWEAVHRKQARVRWKYGITYIFNKHTECILVFQTMPKDG